MAQAGNQDLTERFIQFYRNYYREAIGTLAQRYPNEQRSLYVEYDDLYQFDRDLAEDFRTKPDQMREYAEEALRLYDLPADVSLGRAHVRLQNLPDSIDIRGIRVHDDHIGKLVSVQGIVRKATDVRPKVTEAAFECQRCGTMTYIPQSDGGFQEPHECQGCERQGPFRVNFDQSEFVDSQKLRIQESPEGLRGGETPQSLDVDIVDDITGQVSPGDHVTCVGVLHIEQVQQGNEKSAIFDLYMDGVSIAIEDEEFEDMDITDEDRREIIALSERDDIYEAMVDSIAPAIYGYDEEKLAMILQLFSGVTKHLPDGSRIRGDLHMLLIGDPGTGKCQKYDTKVTLADGTERAIGDLVESKLEDPITVDDGVYEPVNIGVQTVTESGAVETGTATKVWKREAPDRMYRISMASGRDIEVTPSHPLFKQLNRGLSPQRADKLREGDLIAVPGNINPDWDDSLDVSFQQVEAYNANSFTPPTRVDPTLARLLGYIIAEGHTYLSGSSAATEITNVDEEILTDVENCFRELGVRWSRLEKWDHETAEIVRCSSLEFVRFLRELEPAILKNSADQLVPDCVKRASPENKKGFLQAYVDSEGTVSPKEREITVSSMSKELLTGVQTLLLVFGIQSHLRKRHNDSYRLRISGRDFVKYIDKIGFVTDRKATASEAFDEVPENTNTDVIPGLSDDLRRIREALALSQFDTGLPRPTYQHYERGDRNPSRSSLRAVVDTFETRLHWLREKREELLDGDWQAVETLRKELNISQKMLSAGMDVSQTAISYYERNGVAPDGGQTAAATDVVLDRLDEALSVSQDVSELDRLCANEVHWDRIESIESVDPDYEWVYDLEVADTHTYLGNGVVSHNSQMISYVENIAPRSVYTSGKGSSAAGLCVTGDTKIHTSKGFVPIREVATAYHPEPVDSETSAGANHDLYTFDRASGRIDLTESSHVWRMPEKPCRRIKTAHGKELEASVNTPVLTCNENGIEWTSISEVDAGDHVAVPKYTDIDRSSPPVSEYITVTEEKIKPTDGSIEYLRTGLTETFGTLRDAAAELGLSEDFVYDTLSNRHIPRSKLDTILTAIGADMDDVVIDRMMLRHGDSVTIPEEFDADLMYLIGLVFGDGDVMVSRRGGNRGHVRISNGDEALLEHAADIIETTFDKSVDIEYQDDRVPCIRLHSATVARFFSNVGVESPKDDIALDSKLTTAEHADAFLQGLFDADGSVCGRDTGGSSVQFSTVCGELAEQVQLMLETYGIRSRTRERDCRGTSERADGHEIESTSVQTHLAIYGKNLDAFADRIGFRSTTKSAALDEIVRDAPRRGERLPIGRTLARADGGAGRYWQNLNSGDDPSRERTHSLIDDLDLGDGGSVVEEVANADLVWDEVLDAENTGNKEVFDLTVPDTHNFLGNGLVTHNTAAAVRDDFGDGQQWSLEAGALVLADKGIAAVDELDKMDCVTGDTLVSLADGRVERIDELTREAAKDGEIEEVSNGRHIRDIDLDVWTMDEDGRLVKRPVSAVHEYDAPSELTRVTVETGESLTATADHPFFVLDDGERVEREAAALDEGDWVYVPREIPTKAADGGAVAALGGAGAAAEPVGDGGVDAAMAGVLGYLSGDGNIYYDRDEGVYGVRFTNTDEELLTDFERAARAAFDAEPVRHPSEQRDDGVGTVRVIGKAHADAVLDAGMNLGRYDEKCFPTAVSTGCRAAKAAFVRALADSEGHVDESAGNVRIASASRSLLRGTRALLLQFGVSSQLQHRKRPGGRDVYYLTLTNADSLTAFQRAIGFTATRKMEALDRVVNAADGDRTIVDVIPEIDDVLSRTRESLRLYQRECGLNAVTYHDFENKGANTSLHRADRILTAFEDRVETAAEDRRRLDETATWETLAELRNRYHVSQSELAKGTVLSQQQISREWGNHDSVRGLVTDRLREILTDVEETDLSDLREFVAGEVKWRRVESVETVQPRSTEHRGEVLRQRLADVIGGPVETAERRARELLGCDAIGKTRAELAAALDAYGISQADVASRFDASPATVSRWLSGVVKADRLGDLREAILQEAATVEAELRSILMRIEDGRRPKVYDLTVEETHNFVANGLVVHNSSDRSALHEGLEQQKISVSKAGINATLKARCSLLGAANPKYGRFDQYEPIGEQIDLEPALISRFDLIFTVTDSPDPEHDSRLAQHIIKTNYAGELNTQRTELASSEFTSDEVAAVTDEVAPAIDADLLRKYIAHAKRSCYPTMTPEAKALIEEFYVDLRSKGADEDAPVPVTARKLEAMVRLSEASARVRLSDTVEREDADRATSIVESCLQDIGVDPETGQFDADVVETGTSKSQRDRIKNIKGLIADIETEYEEGAPVEEVLDRAGEIGMDQRKAESEIEKLRTKGEVYEPTQGHLRTT